MTTLNHYLSPGKPEITHDTFVRAVTDEFEKVYALPGDGGLRTTIVRESEVKEKKVWDGANEMQTWEWEYGSSPEFSNLIEAELSFGTVVSHPYYLNMRYSRAEIWIVCVPDSATWTHHVSDIPRNATFTRCA